MLAIIGFIMVLLIIYALMQSKVSPMPVFVIVPIICALIVFAATSTSPLKLFDFMKDGVGTTMSTAVLFIFSIVFFGVMTDVGLFDPMVNALVKISGSNVIMVTVASAILATVVHLDGALAATLLVTCPAMLPIYKRLHMRPVVLLAIIGAAMSIMNLLPWGGPVARLGAILEVDPAELWHKLIPLQIVGIVLTLAFAVFMGILERNRIAKAVASDEIVLNTSADGTASMTAAPEEDPKVKALKRPKLIWFNFVVTIAVIGLLCFTKIPLYGAFMIGLALALVVNFPNPKEQTARIKAHAGDALGIPAILLASGVFLGVLKGTGMLTAMSTALISVVPTALGSYLHIIFGIFAVPVGMMLGTDSYFFGLVPLAISVGKEYGITPQNMAFAMLIGKNYGVLVTPHAATTFLAIGLAGIELKELFRFCIPILWALSILSLLAAMMLGIVTL